MPAAGWTRQGCRVQEDRAVPSIISERRQKWCVQHLSYVVIGENEGRFILLATEHTFVNKRACRNRIDMYKCSRGMALNLDLILAPKYSSAATVAKEIRLLASGCLPHPPLSLAVSELIQASLGPFCLYKEINTAMHVLHPVSHMCSRFLESP